VTTSAARLGQRLLAELDRADVGHVSIAEVWRRVGREADRLGVTRPSYERVRTLVHELRRRRGPSLSDTMIELAWSWNPAELILDRLTETDTCRRGA
jgi:hypothetical protein